MQSVDMNDVLYVLLRRRTDSGRDVIPVTNCQLNSTSGVSLYT